MTDVPPSPASGPSAEEAPVCYRHPGRETHIRCQRCDRPICPDCMRSASVGFQCPQCVKEGSRSTRSGRTAYGGKRSGNAALTSQVLVGINALVWLLILATSGSAAQIGTALTTGFSRSRLVDLLALTPVGGVFPGPDGTLVRVPGVADGAYWQLVTSMFTQVQVWHIGFNMLALWVLGPQLELAIGRLRFLALYFISGLAGSAMVLWFGPEYSLGGTLGASGAVFGLMGALGVVALKVGGDVRGILTWIGINFVLTVTLSHISWQGHLGGFVAGAAIGVVLAYAPRERRRTTVQVAGTAAIALIVAVAIVARIVTLS
jgi:membrane associated rhomboid family serine protease